MYICSGACGVSAGFGVLIIRRQNRYFLDKTLLGGAI